jgi:hypothetical protein
MEMVEKLMPFKAPAPTGLLSLPIEIRLQIYYHCIPRKRIIHVGWPSFINFEHDSVPIQDCLAMNNMADDSMYDSAQESERCN